MVSGAVSHYHTGGWGMEREISSSLTFVAKYVVPAVWIPLVGWQVVAAYLTPVKVVDTGGGIIAQFGAGDVLIFWLLGSMLFLWFGLSIKRVRLSDGAILVSNYFNEWRVPF